MSRTASQARVVGLLPRPTREAHDLTAAALCAAVSAPRASAVRARRARQHFFPRGNLRGAARKSPCADVGASGTGQTGPWASSVLGSEADVAAPRPHAALAWRATKRRAQKRGERSVRLNFSRQLSPTVWSSLSGEANPAAEAVASRLVASRDSEHRFSRSRVLVRAKGLPEAPRREQALSKGPRPPGNSTSSR
jgi:hypothetical protein